MEAKLQKKIIEWLKANGVYVIKTRVLPGVPVGCPDIIGLYRDRHCEIEVKARPNAPYRPGQEATLARLRKHNPYVYTANPENWPAIQIELSSLFL